MEKNQKDVTKYIMDQGVIEKERKLDWMYKGPNEMINREEYLLGKPVDKAFEEMAQVEKETELNRAPKNHVEYECIPPSLRFFSGNDQVDLARKIQEDPLYAIKKKEMETRNQLLKNPVKLKHLRELLDQQARKSNSGEEKKKSKHSSSDDETKLDMLLATKYKKLKDISEKNLLKLMRKCRHKKKEKTTKRHNHVSESESDNNNDEDAFVNQKRQKRQTRKDRKIINIDDGGSSDGSHSSLNNAEKMKEDNKRKQDRKHSRHYAKIHDRKKEVKEKESTRDKNWEYIENRRHKEDYNTGYKQQRYEQRNRQRDSPKNEHNRRRYPTEKRNDVIGNEKEERWKSKQRLNLTEQEKDQWRQEMMANAMWHDKERERNLRMYHEEENREVQRSKSYNKDFIRKQLIVATEVGTVASRIKANINNIQRSGRAMDTNFAKR